MNSLVRQRRERLTWFDCNFLNKYDILSRNQYGFRKNYSTAHVLIQLYDKISNVLDDKRVTLGLFIDLSKAFDTVNHESLLDKLEHYGVRLLLYNGLKVTFLVENNLCNIMVTTLHHQISLAESLRDLSQVPCCSQCI